MPQPPGRPGLAPEALDKFRPLHKLRSYHLYRNRAFRAQVGRQIHSPHPAASQLAFDTVFVVERLPDHVGEFHWIFLIRSAVRRPDENFCGSGLIS
jgi:hypothetical protein